MRQAPRHTKATVVSDFRRGQILSAARQSFVHHGATETTVAGIARAAGVAKGTVYLYYRSKDEILRQLLSQDLTELHADTLPIVTEPGSLEEKLRRFLYATLAFFDRKRDFVEQCQREMSAEVCRKARHKLGLVFAAQADAWRIAIDDGVKIAVIAPADPTASAQGIVSLAHGLAIQRLRGWSTEPIDDTVQWATRLLWQGLSTR
jgi:AcrR family transcriptional regulator